MAALKCDHCLISFPEREAVYQDMADGRHVFCCNGCRGVFMLIKDEGLEDFYQKRRWNEPGTPAGQRKKPDIRTFSEDVRETGKSMETDLIVDGIHCASCIWLIEKFLTRTEGTEYVRINFATHRAKIRWNPELIGLEKILGRIQAIGYEPRPFRESEQYRLQKAESRDLLLRFGTAAFLSSQLMIYSIALYAGYFQGIDPQTKVILEIIAMLLTLPVILYSGMPFIKNTITGLRHMHFTMDSLIAIGSGSAFVYSLYEMLIGGKVYFDTAAMIITLILLGRYIESTAKGRASETIERLTELTPKEATKIIKSEDGGYDPSSASELVPVSSLRKGDIVRVLPGEKIPADGNVVYGESESDESILTGESKPVRKSGSSEVIGGSINLFGTLMFEVMRTGKDTVLAGIIRAVEDAQAEKPRLQILADRIVGYFVPAILLISLLTVAGYIITGSSGNKAIMAGVSVLVIACPCSLGLATPLAVLVFTAMASSRGILIKAGVVIENTVRVDHLIFDKTGTITEGRPSLKELISLNEKTGSDELLSMAASLEALSEHSLGRAITSAFRGRLSDVKDFMAVPGRGIQGNVAGMKMVYVGNRSFMTEKGLLASEMADKLDEIAEPYEKNGDTVVMIGFESTVQGICVISDRLRQEAMESVQKIHSLQKRISIVSGDNRTTTEAISSACGIRDSASQMTPMMKRELVHELQSKGSRVMMVGDGINDAPALTEAFVGIAMGRGTDIAMESADAVLVRNDLSCIPYFMRLSARAYSVIRQNIFWAFFYNIVAIPLAVSGKLHPIVAAAAMAASSLFVVLNSLRIRKGAAA